MGARLFDRGSAELELRALADAARTAGVKLLPKDQPVIWSSSSGDMLGDLDHLVASEDLAGTVEVKGWQQLVGPARKQFIAETSDHGSLAIAVP